jgi:hypothetical protein
MMPPAGSAPECVARSQEFEAGDLGRIGLGLRLQAAEIHINELVLPQSMVELGPITGKKSKPERIAHAELLVETATGGRHGPLARTRMPAARIRPQPARMVFARVSLLQQDAAAPVDQEDRERAMQQALLMDRQLGRGSRGPVAFIDQDQGLVRPFRRVHLIPRI